MRAEALSGEQAVKAVEPEAAEDRKKGLQGTGNEPAGVCKQKEADGQGGQEENHRAPVGFRPVEVHFKGQKE